MVQICRENGLTVRVWVCLCLDRNITAIHLWLYRLLPWLFSPSGSHILYPPSSRRRYGRRNTLCHCHAHQVQSPPINAGANHKDSFTFQMQNLKVAYLFTHEPESFSLKWSSTTFRPFHIFPTCLAYENDTSVCPGFATRWGQVLSSAGGRWWIITGRWADEYLNLARSSLWMRIACREGSNNQERAMESSDLSVQ